MNGCQEGKEHEVSPLSLRHPKGELRTLSWTSHLCRIPLNPASGFLAFSENTNVAFRRLKAQHGLTDREYLELKNQKKVNRQTFRGETLHRIYIDVLRTRGEIQFFRLESTKKFLIEGLLIWCICNKTEYTQGMNDIFATITMAILGDYAFCKALDKAGKTHPGYGELLYKRVRPDYFGSDTFTIFSAMMKRMPSFFRPETEMKDQEAEHLVLLVRFVQNNLVKNFDSELWQFLDKWISAPELYMMKWVRLLFSREFEIPQVLQVWDALVQGNNIEAGLGYGLVEYICLSLLRFVRYELLNFVDTKDESAMIEALKRILHFPSVPDIQGIIQEAMQARKDFLALHVRKTAQKTAPRISVKVPKVEKDSGQEAPDLLSSLFVSSPSNGPGTNEKQKSPSAFTFMNENKVEQQEQSNSPFDFIGEFESSHSKSTAQVSTSQVAISSEDSTTGSLSAFDFINK